MSEAQRYLVDPIRLGNPSTSRAVYVVGAADFDAQRLRADTAEAELKRLDNLDTMQLIAELTKRNVAAEQRIAELEGLLNTALLAMKRIYEAGRDFIVGTGSDCDSVELMMENDPSAREIRAALNPKPEAGSHE